MWIADLSKGWPTITGSILKGLGAGGVIVYAGCQDQAKNVSKARFQDYLTSGLKTALVVEDLADSLKGGKAIGQQQGESLYNAAGSLGYDRDHCVLYASADWNSRGADLDAIEAAMDGFGESIPFPGIYGNSYAIDRCWETATADSFWQSESTSFSYGLSVHTNIQQIFNDPRAKGYALDVNAIIRTPIGLMGETIPPEDDDMKAYLAAQPTTPPQYWVIAYDLSHKVPLTEAVYNALKTGGQYQGFPHGGMDQTTIVKIPTLDANPAPAK